MALSEKELRWRSALRQAIFADPEGTMTRIEKFNAEVDKSLAVLVKPHSARELAEARGITEPTAHKHIASIRARGIVLVETRVALAFHGPKAVRYCTKVDSRV